MQLLCRHNVSPAAGQLFNQQLSVPMTPYVCGGGGRGLNTFIGAKYYNSGPVAAIMVGAEEGDHHHHIHLTRGKWRKRRLRLNGEKAILAATERVQAALM